MTAYAGGGEEYEVIETPAPEPEETINPSDPLGQLSLTAPASHFSLQVQVCGITVVSSFSPSDTEDTETDTDTGETEFEEDTGDSV